MVPEVMVDVLDDLVDVVLSALLNWLFRKAVFVFGELFFLAYMFEELELLLLLLDVDKVGDNGAP
jgi:hypothetical protein